MATDTEAFWAPIAEAVKPDFEDLGLLPPYIDHPRDTIVIFLRSSEMLASVSRRAVMGAADRAHVVIEVARAVTPKEA